MPGNDVIINGSIFYYVGDSKMKELIKWLDKNGIKEKRKCLKNK
jgi:hypothetical protein